jgi:hypothetical protein
MGLHAATITAFRRTCAAMVAPISLPESDTLTNVRKPHAFQVCGAGSRLGQQGSQPGMPVLGGMRRMGPDVGE